MLPAVSIILPIYNAAATVEATVASVQAQSRRNWELLMIDDGSTDDSSAIMARLTAADRRLRSFKTNGQEGAGTARNVGILAARGRHVAFIDSDDQWHPEKLRIQLEAMEQAGAVFSCTAYLRCNAVDLRVTVVGVPTSATRLDLLKTNSIACSTVMYDRLHFGSRTMPNLRRRQDYLLWLELLEDTPSVLGIPTVLMTYRQHPKSLSGNKFRAAADTWAVYRAIGLRLPAVAWYFSQYALRGVVRYRWPKVARVFGWMGTAEDPP